MKHDVLPTLWSIHKDRAIKRLLLMLAERVGEDGFEIDSVADGNERAISLCHPRELDLCAYLYTYGQAESRYAVHLEYPGGRSSSGAIGDVYENLNLRHSLELLVQHFDYSVYEHL